MSTETLHIESGAQGLQALLARAVGLDSQAIARLRQYAPETVEVFVTTPFEVVAARRVAGTVGRDGASVSAKDLLDAVKDGRDEIGTPRDASWPGALPPASGFQLLDTLPVHVVRDLADKGQALARQFSGPAGPPSSLMKQSVLTVEADGTSVDIPMRLIFACTNLGLIPGFSAPMDIPRHLRVAALGRWVRVDAPFGSVYHSSRLSLF
ncbi:hypothetical protein NQ042_08580 [Corynebacterium phoceense]|uniref:hypothetical protein n=1 Tax=Corynebacterium phoceense TaxID=1686286 RepID=UPI00211CBE60|nr:hypothetical protein [Corynebacterium phoceense]MCQ9334140.1 hypothetical protein [Corynebacterium phoceense]